MELPAGGAEETPRYAFIGVRSCDLAAIGVRKRLLGLAAS